VRVHVWRPNSENGRLKLAMLGKGGSYFMAHKTQFYVNRRRGRGGGIGKKRVGSFK
jgi:hypothetical protein